MKKDEDADRLLNEKNNAVGMSVSLVFSLFMSTYKDLSTITQTFGIILYTAGV